MRPADLAWREVLAGRPGRPRPAVWTFRYPGPVYTRRTFDALALYSVWGSGVGADCR